MSFISWTLCEICLFEFIRVEGGVKFMKDFKGGASYRTLETCAIYTENTRRLTLQHDKGISAKYPDSSW
jgi:hypothetical protein